MKRAAKSRPLLVEEASPEDIFLQPHSDDVCFSLGHFASQRHAGKLLTLFALSYACNDQARREPRYIHATTRQRLREDAAFAAVCGLEADFLEFPDARARGERLFNPRLVPTVARLIHEDLMHALLGPTVGRLLPRKPTLFCPAAIGGHVDHLAVLLTVVHNLPLLTTHYRIVFYEDLYYAADPLRRQRGLTLLHGLLPGFLLHRHKHSLDASAQAVKLDFIHLYSSQLTPETSTLSAYVPADAVYPLPHEALWILQGERHQRPG